MPHGPQSRSNQKSCQATFMSDVVQSRSMQVRPDLMNLWRSRTNERGERHGTDSLSGPMCRSQPFAFRTSWCSTGKTGWRSGNGAIRETYEGNGTAIQVAGWISDRGGGTDWRTGTSEVCAGHGSNVQRSENGTRKTRVCQANQASDEFGPRVERGG